jgi:hypothetical protein
MSDPIICQCGEDIRICRCCASQQKNQDNITRAEFDLLVQKVEEIHRMLKNCGGQPNVIMTQPYPVPPFIVTCGGTNGQ